MCIPMNFAAIGGTPKPCTRVRLGSGVFNVKQGDYVTFSSRSVGI